MDATGLKLIIAGSRRIPRLGLHQYGDWEKPGVAAAMLGVVTEAVEKSGFAPAEIVSGHAWGIDQVGEAYAAANHLPVKLFPADWAGLGKRAGFARNADMAAYADALVCVMAEDSRGSEHMVDCMRRLNKPFFVVVLGEDAKHSA